MFTAKAAIMSTVWGSKEPGPSQYTVRRQLIEAKQIPRSIEGFFEKL